MAFWEVGYEAGGRDPVDFQLVNHKDAALVFTVSLFGPARGPMPQSLISHWFSVGDRAIPI